MVRGGVERRGASCAEHMDECMLMSHVTVMAMPEYSQSAYRFGDYVAKFGVFPLGEAQKAMEKVCLLSPPTPNLHHNIQTHH